MIAKFFRRLLGSGNSQSNDLSSSTAAPSTGEDWLTFRRYFGEDFWLVTVDQNILGTNETNGMVWCKIDYHFRKDQLVNDMLPTPEVFALCSRFEDTIDNVVVAIGGRMAATETGFSKRSVLYFAPSRKLERTLNELTENFAHVPTQILSVGSSELNKFMPIHLERMLAGNEQIFRSLAAQGDDGSTAREVTNWITNVDAKALPYLSLAVQQQGYTILKAARERIQFSKLCSLSSESMTVETKKLYAFCESANCTYDGWETAVVRPPSH